jgi:hypothetical protein
MENDTHAIRWLDRPLNPGPSVLPSTPVIAGEGQTDIC